MRRKLERGIEQRNEKKCLQNSFDKYRCLNLPRSSDRSACAALRGRGRQSEKEQEEQPGKPRAGLGDCVRLEVDDEEEHERGGSRFCVGAEGCRAAGTHG